MDEKYFPEELIKLGQAFYFAHYESDLKPYENQYVVIDVSTGRYLIDPDKLRALQEAEKKFGKKLFYLVRIGTLRQTINFKEPGYAWKF